MTLTCREGGIRESQWSKSLIDMPETLRFSAVLPGKVRSALRVFAVESPIMRCVVSCPTRSSERRSRGDILLALSLLLSSAAGSFDAESFWPSRLALWLTVVGEALMELMCLEEALLGSLGAE